MQVKKGWEPLVYGTDTINKATTWLGNVLGRSVITII